MASKIVQQTEELVQPILDELSLELVDIVYEKEGPNWFLRVYIDKDDGVDIEECGQVSERLSTKLDEADPITEAYFLEVSSPGVERPLKKETDFEKHIGKHVYVKLYEPISGEKEFTGDLVDFKDGNATIRYKEKTKQKEVEIPFAKIAKARLAVTFD
ncbi:ribosome maturation factor RimP [Gracilibacillus orientalis]|uniref:Ribosome maturation factor RimP n=1 Tax=Gracilibacillus orientalis TaxID=334253 RepID=A0A1I4PUU0_9BACI|nr:ribosome maturation factor RimP [Gracilibacillus orientalis]SFM31622.1 ribosome maturation factor RimP [Gracilibacillus orientalis]